MLPPSPIWRANSPPPWAIPSVLDPDDLARDGMGPQRWFDCLVAEVDGSLIGYAMVCRGYEAHMAKRRLWLSDLYAEAGAPVWRRTRPNGRSSAARRRTRLRGRLLGPVAAQSRRQARNDDRR